MEKIQLDAQKREGTGKGVARALRREKRIPAVIYGGSDAPVLISLGEKDVFQALHAGGFFTQLCDLNVGGEKHLVLTRDVQLDPVKDFPVHADFMRVTERTKIKVNVPVTFVNQDECPGLTKGGLLNTVYHEIEVFCRATKIPEFLEVDLSGLEMGDALTFGVIKMPEGVVAGLGDDETIATITAPAAIRSAGTDGEEGEEGEEGEDAAAAAADADAETSEDSSE